MCEKITVYGLPINPRHLVEQLDRPSFCVSYATRDRLGKQLSQAIELVADDGILLVDNGAYSHWNSGGEMTDDYITGFADWAYDIALDCPQAVIVIPDVIQGTVEQNAELVRQFIGCGIEPARMMPVWHMHEPLSYLTYLCENFGWVAFGSTSDAPGSKAWHARIKEAFAAIDAWEADSNGAYVRPRIHMMRAQAYAHLYPFDSSDSTNLAINHNRQGKKRGETFTGFAGRIDSKIQASAGPAADHQLKRGRLEGYEMEVWQIQHQLDMIAYAAELRQARLADLEVQAANIFTQLAA